MNAEPVDYDGLLVYKHTHREGDRVSRIVHLTANGIPHGTEVVFSKDGQLHEVLLWEDGAVRSRFGPHHSAMHVPKPTVFLSSAPKVDDLVSNESNRVGGVASDRAAISVSVDRAPINATPSPLRPFIEIPTPVERRLWRLHQQVRVMRPDHGSPRSFSLPNSLPARHHNESLPNAVRGTILCK
jgi:hypothetical protein